MSQPLKAQFGAMNPNADATLEHAANDAYAAVLDSADADEDVVWLREQRLLNKLLHFLRRPSVVMIGFCLFLHAFASSSAELLRQMIQFKLACTLVDRNGACSPAETQMVVSNLQQLFALASGVTTIFALGKVGPWLDQYGRRVFIVLILACQLLGKALRFGVMRHFPSLQIAPMVLTEIAANLCGGVVTMATLASCYVSDIAETHQRIYFLGINIASFFVGLLTGPLAGNLLLRVSQPDSVEEVDSTQILPHEFVPLKFELLLLAAVLLFSIFVLPELRSEKARKKSRSLLRSLLMLSLPEVRISKFFQTFTFLRPVRLIAYPDDVVPRLRAQSAHKVRRVVMILILADCLLLSLAMPLGELYVLYSIYRFQWLAKNLGHLLAVTCSLRAVVLIVVSPIINHKVLQGLFKLPVNKFQFDRIDYSMVLLAVTVEVVGLVSLAFVPTGALFLVCLSFMAFGTLAGPALNSLVVKFYPELMIGELFGGMALVRNVCTIVTPLLLLGFYKRAIRYWNAPEVVFIVVAALFAVGLACITYAKYVLDSVEPQERDSRVPDSPRTPRSGSFVLK